MNSKSETCQSKKPTKKPYKSPNLVQYGTVLDITRNNTQAGAFDNPPANNMKT